MLKKIVLSLAGLLLLISPSVSSADLLSDLQAQIQSLLAQVAALQAQQGAMPLVTLPGDDYPTPPIGSSCPNLTVTMQRGSRDATTGGQVSELQIWLANRYGLNDDDVVTGYFGAMTERYVRQFQTEQGLPAYGIVGSLTRAAIARTCQGPILPPPPPTEPKCGVNSFQVIDRCENQSSRYAIVQCHDGYSERLGAANGSSCKPSDTWRQHAEAVCANRCAPRPVACPIYNAPLCAPGDILVSGGVDANGCALPGRCVPPDSGRLNVSVKLEDPTGRGREMFSFGDQLVIRWSASPVSDVELNGWSIGTHSDTGIELRPYGDQSSAGIRIARVKETGVFPNTYTWNISPSGLYGDVVKPGRYLIYVNVASKQQGGYRTGVAGPIWVGTSTPSSGIEVTSPNGGERWEIGTLSTITWAPYGYNPDVNPANQVSVFLVGEGGDKIGKIMDTGKASLHTYFNIDSHQNWAKPGRYYVEAMNTVTGARDRSNAPFTLLPRAVDIMVNGSDGPVTLADNQPITITYTTQGQLTSCTLTGLRLTQHSAPQTIPIGIAAINGTVTGYAYAPTPGSSTAIYATCNHADGTSRGDSVQVNVSGVSAAVRIISPNGGEVVDPTNNSWNIKTMISGLRMFSMALYKNDQWYSWLFRDVSTEGRPQSDFEWVHSHSAPQNIPGISATGDNGGAIWKIYVTGLRSDGLGYIDDKSDAPFSIVGRTSPPACTVSTNKPSYVLGEPIVVTWTSTNASYMAFDPQSSSALNVPGDKLATQGSQSVSASSTGSHTIVMKAVAADGRTSTCAVPLSVGASTVAGAIHATGSSIGSVTSTLYPFTNNAKLAEFTLTASRENVRLNNWVFTVRNVGGNATVATDLAVTTANIGGKEYPVHNVTYGLYSTYSVTLGAGQDFAKDVPTSVTLYGNLGASTGGTIDLWWSANDMKFTGVTSGVAIVPTSSVANRGDNFYWSGWFSVPAAANSSQQGANAAPVTKESQLASALTALTALLGQLVSSLR